MPIPPRYALLTEMRLEQAQAAAVKAMLADTAKTVEADLMKLGKNGSAITRLQLQAQQKAINSYIAQDFDRIATSLAKGQQEAARAASLVVSKYENELLKLALDEPAMKLIAASEAKRAASGVEAALQRMGGSSHVPLSKQVYRAQKLAQGWVDATINRGLAAGWDAKRLAKEIAGSINPKVPGGVSYAANRLARSEINNAFHASAAERYRSSPFVDEVAWNTSSSHPENDVCDEYRDASPFKVTKVPGKPHPFCYCFITPILVSEDEFMRKLLAGEYGDEPWAPSVKPDMQPSKIFPGMSKGEENAVARYTRDSFRFNDDLRKGKLPEDTALLDSAFQHASLARAVTVRRVISGDPAREALSATKYSAPKYSDKAFMSTQKESHGTLEELIDEFGNDRGAKVIFEIRLPKGSKAIDISGKLDDHPEALGYNQGEVLLPRDMQFKMGQPETVGDYRDNISRIRLTPIWNTMQK